MFFFIFGPSIQDFNPYSSLFILTFRRSPKITLANVGCPTPEEVQKLAKVGGNSTPLSPSLGQGHFVIAGKLAYQAA
jgi:hypothetical protein